MNQITFRKRSFLFAHQSNNLSQINCPFLFFVLKFSQICLIFRRLFLFELTVKKFFEIVRIIGGQKFLSILLCAELFCVQGFLVA